MNTNIDTLFGEFRKSIRKKVMYFETQFRIYSLILKVQFNLLHIIQKKNN